MIQNIVKPRSASSDTTRVGAGEIAGMRARKQVAARATRLVLAIVLVLVLVLENSGSFEDEDEHEQDFTFIRL